MALSNSMSTVVGLVLSVTVFSAMQLYRHQLAASGPFTILGGLLGTILFLFSLTAVGNLGLVVFGPNYQTTIFPEVALCLILALIAAGRVHGVCVTTCFIFSIITLYYVNRISQKTYATPTPSSLHHQAQSSGKKKAK